MHSTRGDPERPPATMPEAAAPAAGAAAAPHAGGHLHQQHMPNTNSVPDGDPSAQHLPKFATKTILQNLLSQESTDMWSRAAEQAAAEVAAAAGSQGTVQLGVRETVALENKVTFDTLGAMVEQVSKEVDGGMREGEEDLEGEADEGIRLRTQRQLQLFESMELEWQALGEEKAKLQSAKGAGAQGEDQDDPEEWERLRRWRAKRKELAALQAEYERESTAAAKLAESVLNKSSASGNQTNKSGVSSVYLHFPSGAAAAGGDVNASASQPAPDADQSKSQVNAHILNQSAAAVGVAHDKRIAELTEQETDRKARVALLRRQLELELREAENEADRADQAAAGGPDDVAAKKDADDDADMDDDADGRAADSGSSSDISDLADAEKPPPKTGGAGNPGDAEQAADKAGSSLSREAQTAFLRKLRDEHAELRELTSWLEVKVLNAGREGVVIAIGDSVCFSLRWRDGVVPESSVDTHLWLHANSLAWLEESLDFASGKILEIRGEPENERQNQSEGHKKQSRELDFTVTQDMQAGGVARWGASAEDSTVPPLRRRDSLAVPPVKRSARVFLAAAEHKSVYRLIYDVHHGIVTGRWDAPFGRATAPADSAEPAVMDIDLNASL